MRPQGAGCRSDIARETQLGEMQSVHQVRVCVCVREGDKKENGCKYTEKGFTNVDTVSAVSHLNSL